MRRKPEERAMNGFRGVVVVGLVCCVAGCPEKDDEEVKPIVPAADAAVVVAPADAAAVKPDEPAAPKIEPRVKAEVDGRADGITGAPLAAAGATASLQTPTGWTVTKGDPSVAKSADSKAQLAVSSFAVAEGPAAKVPAAVTALGLTGCTWNPPEALAIGKGKLAGTGADGLCTRGAAPARAAWVAPSAEGLLVVGTWDAGGDEAGMFGAMRAVGKATGGDPTGIAACCAALSQNAKSAPPEQQLAYGAAISLCNAARNDPNGRAALAAVRAALGGAGAPSSCK
jgi:hypothetical protein